MAKLKVEKENSADIDLYYEDHGSGEPVVLIHGWPLSGKSWERQVSALLKAGYRVIAYDRRGFGQSSQPSVGYNYDTFAKDLDALLTRLDLQGVTLVGFSMGGGEVARYIGKYGTKRVRAAVFACAITPALLKSSDNPEGVDASVFEGIKAEIVKDRPAFLSEFFKNFFNSDQNEGKRISAQAIQLSWSVAANASFIGTLESVSAWGEDFRNDLKKCDVPTLVIHGDSDRIVPVEASGSRIAGLVTGAKFSVIKDAPHGLNWTHSEEFNQELIGFLQGLSAGRSAA